MSHAVSGLHHFEGHTFFGLGVAAGRVDEDIAI